MPFGILPRMNPAHRIDWKVLLFALLGCYVLPWMVFGILASATYPPDDGLPIYITGWRKVLLGAEFALHYIGMPLAAGYFTARFSTNRPQLHVLLVALLGFGASLLVHRTAWGTHAIILVVSLAVAALGAFVRLRKPVR